MNVPTAKITVQEWDDLQKNYHDVLLTVHHMKSQLKNFSSSAAARKILDEKHRLKDELQALRDDLACYIQNIKNRETIIHNRRLVSEGKYTWEKFREIVTKLQERLAKNYQHGFKISEITSRGINQIIGASKMRRREM